MVLNSKRLTLKPLSYDELETNYVNWLNDKEVCKYNNHGDTLYTKEMAVKFIDSLKNDKSQEVYAVYVKEDNVHIGNISIYRIDKKNNNAEFAYLFGEKAYWGKGYATEATEILIKRAQDLKLHRVSLGTRIDNIGMQKVAEKMGFKKEGIFKDALYKNGKYYDAVKYGLVFDN